MEDDDDAGVHLAVPFQVLERLLQQRAALGVKSVRPQVLGHLQRPGGSLHAPELLDRGAQSLSEVLHGGSRGLAPPGLEDAHIRVREPGPGELRLSQARGQTQLAQPPPEAGELFLGHAAAARHPHTGRAARAASAVTR